MRVHNNIHNMAALEGAELVEEYEEEEKIPVKKDMPAQPKPADKPAEGEAPPEGDAAEKQAEPPKQPEIEYEIKKKNKKTHKNLKVKPQTHALPNEVLQQFTDLENQFNHEDTVILELKAVKNELESFSYEMRQGLDQHGNLKPFIDAGILPGFLEKINHTVDWLYGEGKDAAKSVYEQKLSELQQVGHPVKQRFKFHHDAPHYLELFQQYS